MEDRADDTSGQSSKVYTSKKRLYILSIFIFIFFVFCSLSLPSPFHSYVARLIHSNDRHYVFLLCNGILLFLFLDSGSTRTTTQTRSRHEHAMTSVYVNDQPEPPVVIQEVEHNVVSLTSVVEEETETEHNFVSLTSIAEENTKTELNELEIQDPETHIAVIVDDEDEMVSTAEVEDDEFNRKCQVFIDKVKRTMHYEAPYGLVIGRDSYM